MKHKPGQQVTRGDLIYSKTFQKSSSPVHLPMHLPGHAVSLMLGHVPPGDKDFTAEDAFVALGACGFISFDQVSEFLGPEQAEVCINMFKEKYEKPKPPKDNVIQIVDANSKYAEKN